MQLSYNEHDVDMIMACKTDAWAISKHSMDMANRHDFNEAEDCNYDEHDIDMIMVCKPDGHNNEIVATQCTGGPSSG